MAPAAIILLDLEEGDMAGLAADEVPLDPYQTRRITGLGGMGKSGHISGLLAQVGFCLVVMIITYRPNQAPRSNQR